MPGETNQWNPELITGNERVEPPKREGYHLSEDIVDQSCKWLRQLVSADPERPFFLYVAFAAGHSPHHVPAAYVEKYKGKFDEGWDKARERILARQKASGLLPEDQRLAPRNPGVQVWDELDDDEKRLAARLMEVYAGFLDHADDQIARLLKQIDALGKRDDTIVIAISDNGASPLGGLHGTYDHQRSRVGLRPSVEENLARLDDMGGPLTYNHYPFGWAMAGNTPFKRYKGHTYGGGVRAPLLIRWPDGIRAKGETRDSSTTRWTSRRRYWTCSARRCQRMWAAWSRFPCTGCPWPTPSTTTTRIRARPSSTSRWSATGASGTKAGRRSPFTSGGRTSIRMSGSSTT